ncbi:unnamed protein product [Boreogadus saida]
MSDVKGERRGSLRQTHSVDETARDVEADELQRPAVSSGVGGHFTFGPVLVSSWRRGVAQPQKRWVFSNRGSLQQLIALDQNLQRERD